MNQTKYDTFGKLLGEIGQEVTDIVGNPDGVFLYVEAGEGWVGPSLFRDEGKLVRWFDPTPRLSMLLVDLWEAEDADKRWSAMEYTVTGTKFHTVFVFPEMFRNDLSINDRREMILNARYGDKPRVYPPIPR